MSGGGSDGSGGSGGTRSCQWHGSRRRHDGRSRWRRPRWTALSEGAGVEAAILLLLLPLLLQIVACGGGGGGGGGPTGPPPPQSSIVFTPAAGGASGISLVAASSSDPTVLVLEVRAGGLTDLYGVAFNLSYPTAVLHFGGGSEGTLLSAGGVRTSFQIAEAPAGNLVVGLSRLGAVPGTNGAGVLMTLSFSGVASGSGQLAFARNVANDSTGAPIGTASWAAGSVQVTIVH